MKVHPSPERSDGCSQFVVRRTHSQRGSALLIMGICGGAPIPQLFAVLKQTLDFQLVFAMLMVPCYLYIAYYATHGHRAGQQRVTHAFAR